MVPERVGCIVQRTKTPDGSSAPGIPVTAAALPRSLEIFSQVRATKHFLVAALRPTGEHLVIARESVLLKGFDIHHVHVNDTAAIALDR